MLLFVCHDELIENNATLNKINFVDFQSQLFYTNSINYFKLFQLELWVLLIDTFQLKHKFYERNLLHKL